MIRAVLIRKLGQLVVLIACLWKRSKLICPAADAAGARAVPWYTVFLMAINFENRSNLICPAADAAGARAVPWYTVFLMAINFENRSRAALQ